MVDRNGGVFFILVFFIDKGLVNWDVVVVVIFDYINMLYKDGIKKSYFDEIVYVLNLDFCYFLIMWDMDYIEWLVDMMLWVFVEYVFDVFYLVDKYDLKVIVV